MRGKTCTFHRAFVETSRDLVGHELEVLVEAEYKAVLTSGGETDVVKGKRASMH
jgi:copper homeostasis protein CutC